MIYIQLNAFLLLLLVTLSLTVHFLYANTQKTEGEDSELRLCVCGWVMNVDM